MTAEEAPPPTNPESAHGSTAPAPGSPRQRNPDLAVVTTRSALAAAQVDTQLSLPAYLGADSPRREEAITAADDLGESRCLTLPNLSRPASGKANRRQQRQVSRPFGLPAASPPVSSAGSPRSMQGASPDRPQEPAQHMRSGTADIASHQFDVSTTTWTNVPDLVRNAVVGAYAKMKDLKLTLDDLKNESRTNVQRLERELRRTQDQFSTQADNTQRAIAQQARSLKRRRAHQRNARVDVVTQLNVELPGDSTRGQTLHFGQRTSNSSRYGMLPQKSLSQFSEAGEVAAASAMSAADGYTPGVSPRKRSSKVSSMLNLPTSGLTRSWDPSKFASEARNDDSSSDEDACGVTCEDLRLIHESARTVSDLKGRVQDMQAILRTDRLSFEQRIQRLDTKVANAMGRLQAEFGDRGMQAICWEITMEHLPQWFQWMGAVEECSIESMKELFQTMRRAPEVTAREPVRRLRSMTLICSSRTGLAGTT